MTRYIFIESHSGIVWGDTGDLAGTIPERDETPEEAAKRLDEHLGEFGRSYEENRPTYLPPDPAQDHYFVYRATDDFQIIEDGNDPDTIRAVEENCKLVAVVTSTPPTTDEWVMTRHL
jgi:hypothetical protein